MEVVVATYHANYQEQEHDDPRRQTVFEFFDEAMLRDFLESRKKPFDGILQKFIEPDAEQNFVLRINWSPKLCVFEKRINN